MNPEPRKSGTYELPRGSVVGKYEIMRRLAVGGMAEIYLARVTGAAGFEKLVVLKRILPAVAEDPAFVQMFLDEAKLAATLRHPNIADVYDVGEHEGTFFFTMEYVYGQDVRTIRHDARKRNEPIPLAIALAIVHGTASALEHAHEKTGPDGKPLNLVHRDVSASNVMVSYDGAVKLLDFGIARASSSTHKTQTGTLKGKIPYMSPEQCKGLPLDRRSDLFSLGTVFYELTVGRRPFRGETDFAIMDQIVYKGAVPPSQLLQGYPPELEAMVMKLLERGPSMRYPTGEDLLHDLDDFIARHGLWMSPRAIGKYMRTLFADKIHAWEQAEQEGVSFVAHVAQTITSQSMKSEMYTPPSEMHSLPPRTTSEQMAIVNSPIGRISKPMRTFEPVQEVSPAPLAPVTPLGPGSASMPAVAPPSPAMLESEPFSRVQVYPSLKPRSSRTIMLAFAGALVLGAGGVIGYLLSKSDKAAASVPAQQPVDTRTMAVEPPAAETKPAQAKPADVRPAETKPADVKPAETKPADVKAAEPVPAVPVVDTQPTVPEKPATTTTATTTAQTKVETKPIAKPKPVHEVKKPEPKPVPEVKKPEPKPEPKPKPTPKPTPKPVKVQQKPEPKEQTWDPNSPFLPQ